MKFDIEGYKAICADKRAIYSTGVLIAIHDNLEKLVELLGDKNDKKVEKPKVEAPPALLARGAESKTMVKKPRRSLKRNK